MRVVLLVDDNVLARAVLARELRRRPSIDVIDAGALHEAVLLLDCIPVDIVVSRPRLPDGDARALAPHLARDGRTFWEGVRNYTARNWMRDQMKVGDRVLFYHSNAEPSGVAGVAEIVREAYADPHALDPKSPYYDETAKPDEPRWVMVDVGFVEKFFRKSRLSFIANMKVKMQEYLESIKENTEHTFTGRSLLRGQASSQVETLEPVLIHIDTDCFFVSVAIRNRPDLKDKPVAVCSNLNAKRKNQDPKLDLMNYRNWTWQDASTAEISCCRPRRTISRPERAWPCRWCGIRIPAT